MKKYIALVLTVTFLIVLFSCGAPEGTGSLLLSVQNDIRSRSLLPSKSMDTDHYILTGTGPQTIPATVVGDLTIVSDLLPGEYTLLLVAENAANDPIGEGSCVVTVVIGTDTQASFTVEEYTTVPGSHSGVMDWTPDCITDPVITFDRKDFAGTVTPITPAVDPVACTATVSESDVPVGFYTLVCQVRDSTELSGGFAEVLRVINDFETTWTVSLGVNEMTGGLSFLIDNQIANPLTITTDPAPGSVDVLVDTTQTFSVTDAEVPGFIATWYVNGEIQAIDQASYDYVANDHLEHSRLDCVVFSADGLRAGSVSWSVNVIELPPLDPYTLATNFWLDDLTDIVQVRIMYLWDNGTSNGTSKNGTGGAYIPVAELTAGEPSTYTYAALPAGDYLICATVYTGSGQYDVWSHGGTSFLDADPEDLIVIPHVGAHLPEHDLGDLD